MHWRVWTLACLAVAVTSCGDDDSREGPIIREIKVGIPILSRDTSAPAGLTWFCRFNNNVSMSSLTAFYAKMAALSSSLWSVSEGQVYIGRVIISDAVAPGAPASVEPVPSSTMRIDVLVYVDSTWDIFPVGGFVEIPSSGRTGRIIGVPESVSATTLLHEAAHLVFQLTWSPGPLLVDEYADGIQDSACIMELAFGPPLRWCSAANHVSQTSQPTSCWAQILTDHPRLAYAGTNTASSPVPATAVDYADNP
jgi:hypothetical protein